MTTIINPDWVQIQASTWENFKSGYYAWEYSALIESVIIFLLVIYLKRDLLTKEKLIGILRQARDGIKAVNESINQAQRENWRRKEVSVFGIGKFWAFVLSGFFTMIVLCCNLIVAYFAVYGWNIATGNSAETVQIVASNNLLFQLGFIQNFLWASFVISLLVIFREYIESCWQKLWGKRWIKGPEKKIPLWIYRGLRYSILILFTTFSFLAVYEVSLMVPYSFAGNIELTSDLISLTQPSQAQAWCNFAGIIDPLAWGFLVYWICSVWLMAFGYLLKYELDYLWKIMSRVPFWILEGI